LVLSPGTYRRIWGWLVLVAFLAACAGPPPSLGDPNLDAGREVFSDHCATCHGGNGQGGAGPALAGVLATFPACDDQIEWVTLGSVKWAEQNGSNYGAQSKDITAVMPEFGDSLSAEEIKQVVSFERFKFGGGDMGPTLTDCGLAPSQ
jgi:mono/diheme cytochrome c family protein